MSATSGPDDDQPVNAVPVEKGILGSGDSNVSPPILVEEGDVYWDFVDSDARFDPNVPRLPRTKRIDRRLAGPQG